MFDEKRKELDINKVVKEKPSRKTENIVNKETKSYFVDKDVLNVKTYDIFDDVFDDVDLKPKPYFIEKKVVEKKEEKVVEKKEEKVVEKKEEKVVEKKQEIPLTVKEKMIEKLKLVNLPEHTREIIKNKINNITIFDKHNEEWLNNFFRIPFGEYSKLPVTNTSNIIDIKEYVSKSTIELDKISYGMENVKEEIIDIFCQLIRSSESNIKVIGLCGSPGVGKTNFIKNGLSKILQRPFQHISMGGITDSAFLIGHESSYLNSRYGILINSLMNSKVMNPIIFMDELDKVSKTDKGIDVENVLIHLTDPVQNMSFMDKYFQGIEIDISKVMFIFSFNDENKISPILRDRMHIVYVKEPTEHDKIEIARQFLMPSLLKNIKLENVKEIDKKVIRKIITEYCKEEKGVRELKRCLEKILLKINTSLYSEKSKYKSLENIDINNIKLTEKMVEDILERPDKFESHNSMYL
jgi:ATP-dependent Lon protease